jgi:Ankyrin repeats (3 copies)
MEIRLPLKMDDSYDLAVLRATPQLEARDAPRALVIFCHRGDVAAATWLADRFELTAADARTADNWALRQACYRGHLATATWLTDRFALTADDVRANDNFALRVACTYGHLDVAAWLTDRFELTPADARSADNHALCLACENGHLAVVQFLLAPRPLGMGATPPQALAQTLLEDAVYSGDLEIVQALRQYANIDNAWLVAQAQQAA